MAIPYRVIRSVVTLTEDQLNAQGAEDFLLVDVVSEPSSYKYIFSVAGDVEFLE